MSEQLTLSMALRDEASLANFHVGDNQELLAHLKAFLKRKSESCLFLWGPPSSGRTHLLQACCYEAVKRGEHAMYLPLRERYLSHSILENSEQFDLIALDDIDAVLNDSDWEEALMHAYNRARDHHTRLLISANQSPANLPCQLADLQSRLSWGLTMPVQPLNDAQKTEVLHQRAQDRGFKLPSEVIDYLLRHYPRNIAELLKILDHLDQASLARHRRLTVPFVKETLGAY